jgi:hypothetical protein
MRLAAAITDQLTLEAIEKLVAELRDEPGAAVVWEELSEPGEPVNSSNSEPRRSSPNTAIFASGCPNQVGQAAKHAKPDY